MSWCFSQHDNNKQKNGKYENTRNEQNNDVGNVLEKTIYRFILINKLYTNGKYNN